MQTEPNPYEPPRIYSDMPPPPRRSLLQWAMIVVFASAFALMLFVLCTETATLGHTLGRIVTCAGMAWATWKSIEAKGRWRV
jgi:hypothetical protein